VPKFMDHHATMPQLPPEAIEQMTARIKAGQADGHGVKPLNVIMGTDGQADCLTEAPSVEAVINSHKDVGFSLDARDVREVMTLV
jgi:hypothetical protein